MNGTWVPRARVPEKDLARVGASGDNVGVEGGKADGEDVGLFEKVSTRFTEEVKRRVECRQTWA